MIYLTLDEIIRLHNAVLTQSGGLPGIKNLGLLDSAVAQPQMTFGGVDLYSTLPEKAAALGFSLSLVIMRSRMGTSGSATPPWNCSSY